MTLELNLRANDFTKGLKPKDLVGIPWRLAFALQDDGWYLRSDVRGRFDSLLHDCISDGLVGDRARRSGVIRMTRALIPSGLGGVECR